MSNNATSIRGRMECQLYYGNGTEVEIDVNADRLWLAAGPAVNLADLWMKTIDGRLDLRVSVSRIEHGIEILVDRGDQDNRWFPSDQAPRITVTLSPNGREAFVTARLGPTEETSGRLRANALVG